MENIKIIRKGNKIEVISFFSNQVFKGEFVDGYLKATPLAKKMIVKALKLEAEHKAKLN